MSPPAEPSLQPADQSRPLGTEGPGGRIGGIDAARALAIIGMVMVHFGPRGNDAVGLLGSLYTLAHGRASILFVVLAGVGVSLLAGSGRPATAWAPGARRRRRRARTTLLYRGAVLLPLGLALQLLDHGILVILQYYALYFVVAALVLRLPDRALLHGAVAVAVAGPVAHLSAWVRRPEWFTRPAVELGDPLGAVAVDLLLAGSYPVVTWTAPLLFGMWLGRQDLRAPAVRFRLVAGGTVVALTSWALAATLVVLLGEASPPPSWEQLIIAAPHSQMPLWLIGSTASGAVVIGLALVVVDHLRTVTWPLVALGQLALTVYVAQLLVLAADADVLRRADVVPAILSVLRFTAVAAAFAVIWRRFLPRGPLEALLRLPRLLGLRTGAPPTGPKRGVVG